MNNGVAGSFRGDVAVTPSGFVGGGGGGGGALSPQLAATAAQLPQVQVATGLGTGNARVAGHAETVSVVDPQRIGAVLDLHPVSGSLARLGPDGIAVSQHAANSNHWRVGTQLPVILPDGTKTALDVEAIYTAAGDAVARARAGEGPTLLEIHTLRLWGHFEGDPQAYRPELADVPGQDPIPAYEQRLTQAGILDADAARAIKDEASVRVEKAIAFAKSSPVPAPETALDYVFA